MRQPIGHVDEPMRQQISIGAQLSIRHINTFFFWCQEVHQQGSQTAFTQDSCNGAITGAETAAATVMSKEDNAVCFVGNTQRSRQHSWSDCNLDLTICTV